MNTTAFRHSPRECDRGGLGKKHTAAKAKSTEKGVESREGTDATTHREGARADLTAAKGKPCLAQAPPAPALGSSPSRPVPSHAAPPVIRHPMNERPSRLTSRGPAQVLHLKREARPGPEASCPGNASLRHLRSFSPSPIHQPRGGGAKDPAPPPSADWIASCSRALLPSLIGWKAHQSSFPPVLFLLLLEVYASG